VSGGTHPLHSREGRLTDGTQRALAAFDRRPPAVLDGADSLGPELLSLPVLVLNRVFQPIRIATARRALTLLYCGTAQVLDGDGELHDFGPWRRLPVRAGRDDPLPLLGGPLRIPRIVRLRRYARCWRATVRLSRRNVMLRDGFQCQYCGRTFATRDLDIDHVVPRSRGGEASWTNLVAACQVCNRSKGRCTPTEAGMPLLRHPVAPRWSHSVQLLACASRRYAEWEPFL
jgi:5-methylcytosine-specific restriction endonuclease McrA